MWPVEVYDYVCMWLCAYITCDCVWLSAYVTMWHLRMWLCDLPNPLLLQSDQFIVLLYYTLDVLQLFFVYTLSFRERDASLGSVAVVTPPRCNDQWTKKKIWRELFWNKIDWKAPAINTKRKRDEVTKLINIVAI